MASVEPVVARLPKPGSRAVGLFCNNHYFPVIVPMINSIIYNNVQARIKVYNCGGFNHLLRSYLSRHVDIIDPDPAMVGPGWLTGCSFRPQMLHHAGLDDLELCLDTDMVVLNNLEWVFKLLGDGLFVASEEWAYKKNEEYAESVVKGWERITGKKLPEKFPVFNGGLYGFNKVQHTGLVELWDKAVRDTLYKHQPLNNDQMVMSAILKTMGVKVKKLPRALWVTTWHVHSTPPKRLGFNESGKIRLYESTTGDPIQLYHYTGNISMNRVNGTGVLMRYYHSRQESSLEPRPDAVEHALLWPKLWEQKHKTPAGILLEYMRNQGPLVVPASFSHKFRQRASYLLSEICCDTVKPDDRRCYAVSLACDYITLLGYGLGGHSWIERPLRALLGNRIYSGDKTIRWDEPADVTLSYGSRAEAARDWADEDPYRSNPEHFHGVLVRV